MFDFLDFMDSDWFVISLEILFLIFIAFDVKKYYQTHDKKKRQSYLLNIILTIGFFVWAAIPFYNKYFTWPESEKTLLINKCIQDFNLSYCKCLDDEIFKEYSLDTYKELSKIDATSLKEFKDEAKKECKED